MNQDLYPIRTVSDLTGVNSVTLRAWERRYGLINPKRTDTGHRLYSNDDIRRIHEILALLDKGISIGQVKSSLSETGGKQQQAASPMAAQRARMIHAIENFDEASLDEAYTEAMSLYPAETVTSELVMPMLEELGGRWQEKSGGIAEEHFFGFYMRNKLGARFHHRKVNSGAPVILMACLPGEHHEIGMLLFALAAHEAGYQARVLGPDLPVDEMTVAAKRARCDAIVLSGSVVSDKTGLQQELKQLTGSLEIPVFAGGRISVSQRDIMDSAGVHTLGNNIAQGVRLLKQAVPLG